MAKTIVLSNQKGGVGKTTTANALALIFRERGYKVLAVDLDPQGNLSFSTGADTDGTATIYEAVSYTHLDVYKRQIQSHFKGIGLFRKLTGIDNRTFQFAAHPVS